MHMRRPSPLPPELDGLSFRTADLEQFGVPRRRANREDVLRPYHGVRAIGVDSRDVLARCRSLEPMLLEGQFFSHLTAIELHGIAPLRVRDVVDVSVRFPRTPPRGSGVVGHALRHVRTVIVHGLPSSPPSYAWCEAASITGREDLVAMGDALLTGRREHGIRRPGVATWNELNVAVEIHRGCPGAAKLAWALSRIRAGVDSPQETRTRRVLVRGGLPEPAVDVAITLPDGRVIHSDLGYPAERIAIEYDGDGHRTSRTQWQRDVERYESMRDAGWIVIRVTAAMLMDPDALVARVQAALSSRRAK